MNGLRSVIGWNPETPMVPFPLNVSALHLQSSEGISRHQRRAQPASAISNSVFGATVSGHAVDGWPQWWFVPGTALPSRPTVRQPPAALVSEAKHLLSPARPQSFADRSPWLACMPVMVAAFGAS